MAPPRLHNRPYTSFRNNERNIFYPESKMGCTKGKFPIINPRIGLFENFLIIVEFGEALSTKGVYIPTVLHDIRLKVFGITNKNYKEKG